MLFFFSRLLLAVRGMLGWIRWRKACAGRERIVKVPRYKHAFAALLLATSVIVQVNPLVFHVALLVACSSTWTRASCVRDSVRL